MLLAELTPDTVWQLAGQALTSGGFAALVWYLVAKQMPKREADERAERAAERRSRDKITGFLMTVLIVVMENPAIRKDERLAEALKKFTEGEGNGGVPSVTAVVVEGGKH